MAKKSVSLSVGRGEKLPVSKGAGLTAKGREKYNRETGSNLKAPAPNPKTKCADKFVAGSLCGFKVSGVDVGHLVSRQTSAVVTNREPWFE